MLREILIAGAALWLTVAQAQVPVQIPIQSSAPTQSLWLWQRTNYTDGTTSVAANPNDYNISLLPDGRLSVQADCNRGAWSYTLDGAQLTIHPGATTLAACGPDSQSSTFLSDLGQVSAYVQTGQQLALTLGQNRGTMFFRAQPPASLTGATWRVVNYNNGREAVVSILADTELSVQFQTGGRVNGDTGCNMFMGTYSISGSNLTFGPLATTRRACISEEANAQEQAFLAALAATTTYELVGDRLTFRDNSGATQVLLVRPTSG